VVASLGGDGSLHHLVEELLRQHGETGAPMVLALAGGTMNGLPRTLGTGGSPERVLRSIVAVLAEGGEPAVRARRLLTVTDAAQGCTRHGFGFATGLVFRAFQEYYRAVEPGLADAIRASVLPLRAALFGGAFFAPVRLEVEVEGAPWMRDPPHTLVASVTDHPLLWFRPFGAPLGEAPAFHLAALAMRPGEIAPRLWALFRGHCRHPRLRIGQVHEATVRGDTGYLIDGDLYPPGAGMDLRLCVGPRLRFVQPLPGGRAEA
jgi:hypothetical protein